MTRKNEISSSFVRRAHELVAQMTLEEKISQMVYAAAAIERLDIPEYNWWSECLHGLGRAGVATVFPQAIGLAATWNPDLLGRLATATSDEARAKHHAAVRRDFRGIYAGLTFWSPNINIFRDPRWGRGQETYGEDPYLSAVMAVSFIKGLQGDDPDYLKVVATPKHYAVHSGPEPDRHHFDARINEGDLRDFYLFAFEACIKEAGAASIMGAYNRVNGEPACASPTLLEKILRQEWGFDGYVVSDCWAILDIFKHHKVTASAAEAAALAVENGCDLNCGSVFTTLGEAVAQGLITEESIDRAVRRLFVARFRLGLFEPPEQTPYAQIPYEVINSPDHQALALQVARESMVLLKNEGALLPLSKDIQSIAVIGPNANDVPALLGNYNGTPATAVTPLDGIRQKIAPEARLYYAQGCEIAEGILPLQVIPSTYLRVGGVENSESGLRGVYYSGRANPQQPLFSRVDKELNFIWKDTNPVTGQWGDTFRVTWEGYLVPPSSGIYRIGLNGYSTYRLTLDGQLVAESSQIHHPQLKDSEVEMEAGRLYRLRIEYVNEGLDPQLQLLWRPPNRDDRSPALEAARKAEVIIAVMGLSQRVEGEEMPVEVAGFAGGDRTAIQLPGPQEALLKELHALGKPVVLVLINGSPLAVNWADEHIPAILEAWYPGQAGGQAIADVLFGDYNPGGKVPVTFHKSVDDLPRFEDYELEGHTYRYFRGDPLYPFGHGLSFTHFEFEKLHISPAEVDQDGSVYITFELFNRGRVAGDEVVQLYIHRPGSRASKSLVGFKRLTLPAQERREVTFTLHAGQLGSFEPQIGHRVRPGPVEVMVGNSSGHLPLAGEFTISGPQAGTKSNKIFFSDVLVS